MSRNIKNIVNKVNNSMAQEGMPLTQEIKTKIYNCLSGKTTTEKERKKTIEKYRKIYD